MAGKPATPSLTPLTARQVAVDWLLLLAEVKQEEEHELGLPRLELAPTTAELIDASNAPGLLRDQPAVQQLLRENGPSARRAAFRLIEGGA